MKIETYCFQQSNKASLFEVMIRRHLKASASGAGRAMASATNSAKTSL